MSRPILAVLSTCSIMLVITMAVLAQQTAPSTPPPLPPPLMDPLLDKLVGHWVARGEMGGIKYIDHTRSRWGLNKQFFITEVKSVDPANPNKVYFEGMGLLKYLPERKQYLLHWFDAYGSIQEFIGQATGDVMTLTSREDKRTERLTFTIGKGSYKLAMDAAEGGGEMKREWESTYTRFKTAPPPPPPPTAEKNLRISIGRG